MPRLFRTAILFAGTIVVMSFLIPVTGPLGDPSLLDRCPAPSALSVREVTDTSAVFVWHSSDSALQVNLEWRHIGDLNWVTILDVQSPYTLVDLAGCLDYEVRLQALCNGSDSEFSESVVFEADGCCRIPTFLHLISSTESTASIGWDAVSFAYAHHIRYRALDDEDWINLETDTNLVNLLDLQTCTPYEIQVGSQCDLDSTEFSSSVIFQTQDCGACTERTYCDAAADDAYAEWIDSIAFGSLRLQTGSNQGYLLMNTVQTGIERERAYIFHVTPAATFGGATFFLRMWIDLDQDGLFTDSTELLVDPQESIDILGWSQSITLPDSVKLGPTRMRIVLKSILGQDTIRPSACGNFLFGEVEDYCISIDDVCPEIEPVIESVTQTSAVVSWTPVDESIVFIYQYRNINDAEFGEPELTQDTIIEITGLEKCEGYILRTLSVCVQDTSSWQEFFFETECPNAVRDVLPVSEDLRVYPNPFSEHLTISMHPIVSGKASLRLFNIFGSEVSVVEIDLLHDTFQQVQLTELDALTHGMYVLALESGDRRQLIKVVK